MKRSGRKCGLRLTGWWWRGRPRHHLSRRVWLVLGVFVCSCASLVVTISLLTNGDGNRGLDAYGQYDAASTKAVGSRAWDWRRLALVCSNGVSDDEWEDPVQRAWHVNQWILSHDLLESAPAARGLLASSDSGGVSVLFVTKSKSTNFARRHLTRTGWMANARKTSTCWCGLNNRQACTKDNSVCRLERVTWTQRFVTGILALDDETQQRMGEELAAHLDMILYPRVDKYSRLTWKVFWALRHLTKITFDYLMLLDDDCYVQLWRVAGYLRTAPRRGLYAGHVKQNPVTVSRYSRWQVSEAAYNLPYYPLFAWGAGIILSSDVVSLTVHAADQWKLPWFGVDDAFMGILLNSSGIPPVNIQGMYTGGWHKFYGCLDDYSLPDAQPLLIAGDEAEMRALVAAAEDGRSLCTVLDGPMRSFILLVTSLSFQSSVGLLLVILVLLAVLVLVQR